MNKIKILLLLFLTTLLSCGGENWIYITSFKNNWQNYDKNRIVRIRKEKNGIVFIQGVIKGGPSGSVAFQLPQEFCPSRFIEIPSGCMGEFPATITIDTSGNVSVWYAPGTGTVFLTCCYTIK